MNKQSFLRIAGGLLLGVPLLFSLPSFVSTTPADGALSTLTVGKPPRRVEKTEADWKKILTPQQFSIMRQAGTEPAFTSPLADNHQHGVYRCVGCHEPLFTSEAKFESGTGWPSFFTPVSPNIVNNRRDTSYGTVRTEVQCAVCDAHLGHVFADGPKPTGLRYCINGTALEFVKK